MPVAGSPVVRQVPGVQRQNLAGQSLHARPGQNQEPSVIDDPRQVALSLLLAPPDPSVSTVHLPGGGGPQEAGQFPIAIPHPVAQVRPERRAKSQTMIAFLRARAITGSPPGLPPRPIPAARTRLPRAREAKAGSLAEPCQFAADPSLPSCAGRGALALPQLGAAPAVGGTTGSSVPLWAASTQPPYSI